MLVVPLRKIRPSPVRQAREPVERTTISAVGNEDATGNRADPDNKKMTYTKVNAILTGDDAGLREQYGYLYEDFRRMHDLYEILRKRRQRRQGDAEQQGAGLEQRDLARA